MGNNPSGWASGLAGLAAAPYSFLFGAFTPIMMVLLIAGVCDWVAGSWVACQQPGGWSAHLNALGIAKKLGILMVLALCHSIDVATAPAGNPGILLAAGTFWYAASEGLSLIKNLRLLGVPVFPGLGDALNGIGAHSGALQVEEDEHLAVVLPAAAPPSPPTGPVAGSSGGAA